MFSMKSSKSSMEKFLLILQALISKSKKWIVKNKRIAAPAGIVAALFIIVLVVVLSGTGKKEEASKAANADGGVSENATVPDEPLEENKYPEVNDLINEYYTALAAGDMDTVVVNRNYTEDTEKIRLEKKSQYIEEYRNIQCYTKKGMLENTFLAYVSYEVKFKDIDTAAPALNTLYICPNEEGKLYIYEGEIDDNVSQYLQALSSQDDVKELINKVQVSYKEAIGADEKLDSFLAELPTKIKTEVGEALAAAEAGSTEVSGNEAPPAEAVSGNEAPAAEPSVSDNVPEPAPQPTVETVKTTDTVNVRSSDSETADKVGKADSGMELKRLEVKENGWSKIEFEGKEAYIKTEFLQVVENAPPVTEPPAAEQPEENQNPPAEIPATPEGMVTVKETVNVRKSASETGEKLGVAYQGENYDLIMKQADGWTKIKYKDRTGYVKSEYLN